MCLARNTIDSDVEMAVALHRWLYNLQFNLIFGITVFVLPFIYILQDGSNAGLWFIGGATVGTFLTYLWKPVAPRAKIFNSNLKFKAKVEEYMNGIYQGSKSWIIGAWVLVYVLIIILVPPFRFSTKFPNDLKVMVLLSVFYAFSVYNLILGLDFMRAANLKKISQLFNVSEGNLSLHKSPYQHVPRTLSVSIASAIMCVWATLMFLFGIFLGVSMSIPSGLLLFGLLGGTSLLAAHELRKMERTAALLCLGVCGIVISLLYLFSLIFILPQPLYLTIIWWCASPIAVVVVIMKNWKKMRWRNDLYLFFEKQQTDEDKPQELV